MKEKDRIEQLEGQVHGLQFAHERLFDAITELGFDLRKYQAFLRVVANNVTPMTNHIKGFRMVVLAAADSATNPPQRPKSPQMPTMDRLEIDGKDKDQYNVMGKEVSTSDDHVWQARRGYRISEKLSGKRIPRLSIAKKDNPRMWLMFITRDEARELRDILDRWLMAADN